MSIQIMCEAWKQTCRTHTQKLVLLCLADNANDEGFCWPSITTIAKKCDLSRRSAFDQITELSKDGMVQRVRRVKNGLFTSNGYWVLRKEGSASGALGVVNGVHQGSAPAARGVVHPLHTEPSIEPSLNLPPKEVEGENSKIEETFEIFWRAYPRREAKKHARKAFVKAKCYRFLDALLLSIEKHKKCDQWLKDHGQYIPHPASWLNAEGWLNEVKPKPTPMAF